MSTHGDSRPSDAYHVVGCLSPFHCLQNAMSSPCMILHGETLPNRLLARRERTIPGRSQRERKMNLGTLGCFRFFASQEASPYNPPRSCADVRWERADDSRTRGATSVQFAGRQARFHSPRQARSKYVKGKGYSRDSTWNITYHSNDQTREATHAVHAET